MLKQTYNELLNKFNQATVYMENQKIPIDERMKHFERYQNIIKGLNQLLIEIKDYTTNEVLYGFNVEVEDYAKSPSNA